MMIGLMKRIAHAISGIGEKPALLTEGGLLLALKVASTASEERGGSGARWRPFVPRYGEDRVCVCAQHLAKLNA
jgi:hypothetical protein